MTPRTSARVRIICDIMGLACVSAAGFAIYLWLGLILTGLSFIALSWRLDETRGSR